MSEIAREFANSKNGLALAPAGCGKTHLIADAVVLSKGRQLVLTHTHAGVRAILNHMKRRGLTKDKYRVATIDGFALRYATAFSSLSGWSDSHPQQDSSWAELRSAAVQPLKRSSIRKVIRCSYSGAFIDEYQDCTAGQHQLISELAEIIPCRVVGDPLQSIFWKINEGDHVSWNDVESQFVKTTCDLSTPHRWRDHNNELGEWLLDVRARLINGEDIDLKYAPIVWNSTVEQKSQLSACFSKTSERRNSTIAIRKWPHQCQKIVRSLNGTYDTMESVECKDLHKWAKHIENSSDKKRAIQIAKFAKVCFARLPPAINQWIKAFESGKRPNARRNDFVSTIQALIRTTESNDLRFVAEAMTAFERLEGDLVYVRREVWRELKRAVCECVRRGNASLIETTWNTRNQLRHVGRQVDKRCVGTTLLVKGLEFDNAIILDVDELEDAENLYVAMTRGCKSLTLFSQSSTIQRAIPTFVSS